MEENWKDIIGYEGYYQVSDIGRVKSISRTYKRGFILVTTKEKILVALKNTNYLFVGLSKNGIRKGRVIHRLVAIAFLPNTDSKPNVNHIDGNKLNNHVSNLEWCTQKENIQHSYRNGLQKPLRGKYNNQSKPLIQIDNCGNIVGRFYSCNEAARLTGFLATKISDACLGNIPTHKGFIWEYVPNQKLNIT